MVNKDYSKDEVIDDIHKGVTNRPSLPNTCVDLAFISQSNINL